MSKERLGFDLERETKRLKEIVDKDDRLTISSRFMKYFIEQAERVQELEKENKFQMSETHKNLDKIIYLDKEKERYKQALEFYADEENYNSGYLTDDGRIKTLINDDNGETARKALKGE